MGNQIEACFIKVDCSKASSTFSCSPGIWTFSKSLIFFGFFTCCDIKGLPKL